jgi:hypothetical protein
VAKTTIRIACAIGTQPAESTPSSAAGLNVNG